MRHWRTFFALILPIILISAANADFMPLRTDIEGTNPQVTGMVQTQAGLEFTVSIPGMEITEAVVNGKRWDRVEIPGGAVYAPAGQPEVPHYTRLIAIPPTSGVRVEFEPVDEIVLSAIELIPAQVYDPETGPTRTTQTAFDPVVYETDSYYPADGAVAGDPALFHGCRVVPLRMQPVKYNPITQQLKVAHRFKVRVFFEGTDLRNVQTRTLRPMSRSWAKVMQSAVLNFDELDAEVTIAGSYLIVCENDTYLINTLLVPLVDWKKRKGHTVIIETFTPGSSNTTIKGIIQNAYNSWDIPPEYVLLVGDTSGDYALPGWSPSGIDHPYSQLDGTDILADVAVGRIPADNAAHVVALCNKVLWYEKMAYTLNTNWYHQGCLVAGSYLSGLSTIQTNRWIKTRMIENQFTRIDTFWYTMSSGSVNTCIVNAVNDGVSFVNYRGWLGMENFTTTSIDNLTNGFMMPFTTTLTCGTGGFDGDSFMEHFFSAGTATVPQGAVASIGTATTSTHTRYNNTIDIGIYAGLFDEGITQAGNALVRGKLEVYNAYQAHESGSVSNYSLWNALAGDPGLELYTGAIQFMECNIPTYITWGENVLSLTVNKTGVGPLEDAMVCLYKDGEFQEVGLTDAGGQITLPLNAASWGNVKVTITKQNFKAIVDSVDVIQMGVAVGYFGHEIDDDINGSSNGDGDHVINPGEDVEIPLTFKNFGSSYTATGISVTATEDDPYVTLNDNSENFPDMAPGGTGTSYDDLDLFIANNCPNGHNIHLDFNTTTTQGNYIGGLDLQVANYEMACLSAYTTGSDTVLSPGETADFYLTVQNVGGKTGASLTATITSLCPKVTVNDNQGSFGTVNVGATATCSDAFNLTADVTAITGQPAALEITYTNSLGAVQVDTITIYLGTKTITDPQGPDNYGYYCFDDADSYPQAPVFDWIEIDPAYGGSGTQLNIIDPSDEQDDSEVISLPFEFFYYGEPVSRLTVCSNGWAATHSNDSFTDFRNYPIPAAMGPSGMLAPFWDNLITWSGGHVFEYYDSADHRFILEWSRLKHQYNTGVQETFEIVLFDPAYYTTPTGDGDILFQYLEITEVYNYDNPYSTIGIESPDQQDGIEVAYWNDYEDPAAAHVQNNRAYLFTTVTEVTGDPPVIGVSPTSLSFQAPAGGIGSDILTISNSGELNLSYSISLDLNDQSDATGGPDNYGYVWIDSDEAGGPTYNWIDISGTGTAVTFTHNDSTSSELPIGFSFPHYGNTFSEFILSANGWLSFTSHSGEWSNTTLPNPEAPFDLISPFWDDLDPLQPDAEVLYWSNNSDSLVISFLQVPHWGSTTTGEYTFQMILTADGDITYQYQALSGNYQSCTVGMQNSQGNDGLEIAFDESYLHTNLAVQIIHPTVAIIPTSGGVPGGQSRDVEVIAYAFGLTGGSITGTLGIDCNDPVTPHIDVPLTVTITSGNPGMVVELTYQSGSPVPVGGGNVYFDVYVSNNSGTALDFDAWIDIAYEGGAPTTAILRSFTDYQPGWTVNRPNTWFPIPGSYAGGNYTLTGRVGNHPSVIWDESGFAFVKEGDGDIAGFIPWIPEGMPDPFDRIITGSEEPDLPLSFALEGPYPNPFNPVTTFTYALPEAAKVNLTVYDISGRLVQTLVDSRNNAGHYRVDFDAETLASGVYFYKFTADDFNRFGKLVLIK